MKNRLMIAAAILSLVACSSTKKTPATEELAAHISVKQPVKVGEPLMLTFTVKNGSSKELKFCKWHTPFEGFKNSYFLIKNSNGEDAQYKGVMAKRIMPPPAESYMAVPAGDSVTVSIDLLQAYVVDKAGKYTIQYEGNLISELKNVNEASFVISE
jgi:hypothetical protein